MLKNEYEISTIIFTRAIRLFCPLGNDNYQATIKVIVCPDEILFDFCKVDKEIQNLSKQSMIAEEVADSVYKIIQEYKPKKIIVSVYAESNTHFPVTIIKSKKVGNTNEKNQF